MLIEFVSGFPRYFKERSVLMTLKLLVTIFHWNISGQISSKAFADLFISAEYFTEKNVHNFSYISVVLNVNRKM